MIETYDGEMQTTIDARVNGELPTLFLSGVGLSMDFYQPLLTLLPKGGHDVETLDLSRKAKLKINGRTSSIVHYLKTARDIVFPNFMDPNDRDSNVTLDHYLDIVDDQIESLGGTVNLAGHSWGGTVAIAYAIKNPDKVGRVVALNPVPKNDRYALFITIQGFLIGAAEIFDFAINKNGRHERVVRSYPGMENYSARKDIGNGYDLAKIWERASFATNSSLVTRIRELAIVEAVPLTAAVDYGFSTFKKDALVIYAKDDSIFPQTEDAIGNLMGVLPQGIVLEMEGGHNDTIHNAGITSALVLPFLSGDMESLEHNVEALASNGSPRVTRKKFKEVA